jgi:cell division protein FtsW
MRTGWQRQIVDVVRKHRPDYKIVLYMGLLMLFGLIVIYAIGPQRANILNSSYGSDYSETYFFIKQTVSLILALGAFAVMAFISYKWLSRHSWLFLGIGLGACLLLFVTSELSLPIAQCSLGACRWFDLGALGSLQPAEIVKFGLLVYTASFLAAKVKEGKLNSVKETLMPLGIILVVAMGFIIVIQKDLGTGIALTAIVMTILFVAGLSKKILLTLLGALLVAGTVFIVSAPHRVERVLTYLQGDNTSIEDDEAYHIQHAKIAIGSGGLFGLGIGNSIEATGYLPEAINDSVFAIMAETFGFIGSVAIIVLFVALLMRLLKVMDHLVDIHMKLLVAGVFGWFGAHVILNIAAMTGIFPLTGITLPLLSFGGTSMIFIAAALGLAFQLSRYTIHPSRLKEADNEDLGSRRGIRRSRYAGRSGS